jgi:hypothetical protein
VLDLRHQWADGTTHLVFEPLELLERLAAPTPRPRINLLLYLGGAGGAVGVAVTSALCRDRPSRLGASSIPFDAAKTAIFM